MNNSLADGGVRDQPSVLHNVLLSHGDIDTADTFDLWKRFGVAFLLCKNV